MTSPSRFNWEAFWFMILGAPGLLSIVAGLVILGELVGAPIIAVGLLVLSAAIFVGFTL